MGGGKKKANATPSAGTPRRGAGKTGANASRRTTQALRSKNAKNAKAG
jgi:hypothetical protein